VNPGTFCGFISGERLHFGFSVDPEAGFGAVFVTLSPNADTFAGRPGIIGASNFGDRSVMAFDNARVRLPFDARAARIGGNDQEIAGALVLIEGAFGVVAFVNPQAVRIFNLADGTAIARKKELHPFFASWSVEMRDDDKSWKTLFEFSLDKAGAMPAAYGN